MTTTWQLPALGENIDSAKIIRILVAAGDTIQKDQPVLEVETDKVNMEIPAPFAGTIRAIHIHEGQAVAPGADIFTLEGVSGAGAPTPVKASPALAAPIGTAARVSATPRTAPTRNDFPGAAATGSGVAAVPEHTSLGTLPSGGVRAAPATRKLARELGLELSAIPGSGPRGLVLLHDVREYARERIVRAQPGVGPQAVPLPDFRKWGTTRREAMSSIRRKTAERMAQAWSTIPHVTHFDEADITALEALRKKWGAKAKKAGAKLTITAFVLQALAHALRQFPQFNASLDIAAGEIVFKDYVHLGVAVDTPEGLLVPVLRDVDRQSTLKLAQALQTMGERARHRQLTLDEIQGASCTFTNLGGIGGTNFTPIINPPEVAILAASRGRELPVRKGKGWAARLMLPLSLSYDHRLIDGADAARFVRFIVEQLEATKNFTL